MLIGADVIPGDFKVAALFQLLSSSPSEDVVLLCPLLCQGVFLVELASTASVFVVSLE